jgi:hypothetical protein
MAGVPKGIPALTYVRVLDPSSSNTNDIVSDDHSVTVLETGLPSSRFDANVVLEKVCIYLLSCCNIALLYPFASPYM